MTLHLDTASGCAEALQRITEDLERLPSGWAKDEARLKVVEEQLATYEAVALLAAEGDTATELKARARKALSEDTNTQALLEERAELQGRIEGRRRVYSVRDRQSGSIQSLLRYHLDEDKRGSPYTGGSG